MTQCVTQVLDIEYWVFIQNT